MVIIFTSPIFSIFMSISVAVIHTIRSEMTEEESRVGILKELELDVDDFRKHTAPLIPAPVATEIDIKIEKIREVKIITIGSKLVEKVALKKS